MITFLFFVLIADGSQTVMAHALQVRSETWVPARMSSLLSDNDSSGWLLSHSLGHGAIGLLRHPYRQSCLGLTFVSTVLVALPTGLTFGLPGVRRFRARVQVRVG